MSKVAQIRVSESFLVIGSKGNLKCFSIHHGSCLFSYIHKFDNSMMDGNSNPLEEKLEDMCISNNEKYLCVMYSDKKIIIVDTQSWSIVNSVKVKRRPTAMTFEPDCEHILAADKSGDLYRYHVSGQNISSRNENDSDEELQPILGHVSMLLDVATSVDGKYILTADRDEKLRVSSSQQPYVIESFCLGHTEFVCKIQPLSVKGKSLVLSASGDTTVRLWDVASGSELMKRDVSSLGDEKEQNGDSEFKYIPSILCISGDNKYFLLSSNQIGQPSVKLFRLNDSGTSFQLSCDVMPTNCQRICDVRFAHSSNRVYVLVVKEDTKMLNVLSYCCKSGKLEPMENTVDVDPVNTGLKDFPVDDSDTWITFYKNRCEGEPFSSYFKKKEERIVAKNKRRRANEVTLKRARIES